MSQQPNSEQTNQLKGQKIKILWRSSKTSKWCRCNLLSYHFQINDHTSNKSMLEFRTEGNINLTRYMRVLRWRSSSYGYISFGDARTWDQALIRWRSQFGLYTVRERYREVRLNTVYLMMIRGIAGRSTADRII